MTKSPNFIWNYMIKKVWRFHHIFVRFSEYRNFIRSSWEPFLYKAHRVVERSIVTTMWCGCGVNYKWARPTWICLKNACVSNQLLWKKFDVKWFFIQLNKSCDTLENLISYVQKTSVQTKVIIYNCAVSNFYGEDIEIWAGFGPVGNTEKEIGPIMSNFWGQFLGAKK